MFWSPFFSHGNHWPTQHSYSIHRHTATEEPSRCESKVLAGRRRNAPPLWQHLGLVSLVVFVCCLTSLAWGQEESATQPNVEEQRRDLEEVAKLNQQVAQLRQGGAYAQALEIAQQSLEPRGEIPRARASRHGE